VDRSDAELLSAHLRGDPSAFRELVDRHARVLWSIARRSLADERDAAEAVQDTLVKAHQNAGRFRGDASVRGWLVRILANACHDHYRLTARRPPPTDRETDLALLPAPQDPISRHELRLDLQDALAELPFEQRLVVVLINMHGYPTDEVAAMLGVPVGTVKSRAGRGRARLLQVLAEHEVSEHRVTEGTP
jgi:RNA polymerase sigma-70 factor (ECF subfamily)